MTRTDFSASNLYRRVLCPGSLRMESGLPDVRNDDSDEGTMLHSLAADIQLSRDDLSPEQTETLEVCGSMESDFFTFVEREHGAYGAAVHNELELPFKRDNRDLFFNHIDRLFVWPKKQLGALLDYKFGRTAVSAPESNLQIRTYCVVAAEHFGLEKIYGAIIQPRVSRKIQSTLYQRADIAAARQEIEAAYEAARHLDAPRRPSLEACRWCKGLALGICPDVQTLALSVRAASDLADSPELALAKMSPEDRARLIEAFALARKLDKTFTDAAKKLVAKDAGFIPGWQLVPGGERETVTDPLALFTRLSNLGVSANEFIDICATPKKKLNDLVRAKTQLKGKALAQTMEQLLTGLVDTTPIAPSLERVA